MSHIFYICFAILAVASSVVSWQLVDLGPKARHRPESLEIREILSQLKRARTNAVDMDYFGESVEREHPSQRTSAEMSDGDRLSNPFTERSPIVMYLTDPKVNKYQRKRVRVDRRSSSEDDRVSYSDILQFLIQLDARLKEQQGRKNQYSHENTKLIDFLRTFRRVNEEESGEGTDETEEQPVNPKEVSVENFQKPRKGRIYMSEGRNLNAKQEKIYSKEKAYKPRNPPGKHRFDAGHEPPKFNFMRTSKPFLGKRGIYEEK